MANKIRHLRSSVAGKRPTGLNTTDAGSFYINFADKVVGYIDATGNPIDLAGRVYIKTTPPTVPKQGDLWFDTNHNKLHVWIDGLPGKWTPMAGPTNRSEFNTACSDDDFAFLGTSNTFTSQQTFNLEAHAIGGFSLGASGSIASLKATTGGVSLAIPTGGTTPASTVFIVRIGAKPVLESSIGPNGHSGVSSEQFFVRDPADRDKFANIEYGLIAGAPTFQLHPPDVNGVITRVGGAVANSAVALTTAGHDRFLVAANGTCTATASLHGTTPANTFTWDTQPLTTQSKGNGDPGIGFYKEKGGGTAGILRMHVVGANDVQFQCLDWNGSAYRPIAASAFPVTSDYRLKDNIQPITGALDRVSQIKPSTYTWKADGTAAEGFIAHELAPIVPQAVFGQKDAVDADGNPEHQQVDYAKVVPLLTAAIQELTKQNQALEARLKLLEMRP